MQVNERGRRIGEPAPRAKLSDREAKLIRDLYEELVPDGKITAERGEEIARRFARR
jgi:hypothetical protein